MYKIHANQISRDYDAWLAKLRWSSNGTSIVARSPYLWRCQWPTETLRKEGEDVLRRVISVHGKYSQGYDWLTQDTSTQLNSSRQDQPEAKFQVKDLEKIIRWRAQCVDQITGCGEETRYYHNDSDGTFGKFHRELLGHQVAIHIDCLSLTK